ncbi:MAG: ABC transporter permease [Microscillaceae bacterium]|nr:ABC transporter permease [Microscillaceae bacterium]
MKSFLAFVRKEFIHVWRDRKSLLILLGMPAAMVLIFGFALSDEVKESNIYILDYAQDQASHQLAERFENSRYFKLRGYLQSPKEIDRVFRENKARLTIIFPRNFYKDLMHQNKAQIQLISDASDANTANTVSNYASNIILDYQREQYPAEVNLPLQIQIRTQMLYNPLLESAYNFVPGVITLVLILLSAMMTSVAIVKEKEVGTMELVLVSPTEPLMMILSKMMPYLLLSFVDVLIILFLSRFVLGVPVHGSLILLLMVCVLYITTALALGLLISTITNSQQVAMFISLVGLLMPSLIFSGFMFPLENMPLGLQYMSNLFPTRWFFIIVQSIMIKGLGISSIWKEILILAFMTFALIGLSLRNFKVRLG